MRRNRACRFVIPGARLGILAFFFLASCGGDGGAGPAGQSLGKASPSGDAQAGRVGQDLADPLRVRVTENGVAVAGVTVSWQVTGGGGSVDPASGLTDASGIASTTVTLPNTPGQMTIRASASGAGSTDFTALAAGAAATVQVTNNTFQPDLAAVAAGGTVTFDWPPGSLQHNVVPATGGGLPNLPAVQDGPATESVVFPTAGTFNYFCSVHGSATAGMRGTILVVP